MLVEIQESLAVVHRRLLLLMVWLLAQLVRLRAVLRLQIGEDLLFLAAVGLEDAVHVGRLLRRVVLVEVHEPLAVVHGLLLLIGLLRRWLLIRLLIRLRLLGRPGGRRRRRSLGRHRRRVVRRVPLWHGRRRSPARGGAPHLLLLLPHGVRDVGARRAARGVGVHHAADEAGAQRVALGEVVVHAADVVDGGGDGLHEDAQERDAEAVHVVGRVRQPLHAVRQPGVEEDDGAEGRHGDRAALDAAHVADHGAANDAVLVELDEHVVGLHVGVHVPRGVHVREAARDVDAHGVAHVERQPLQALERQRRELREDERRRLVAEREQRADVPVHQRRVQQRLQLLLEHLALARVADREDLHRDGVAVERPLVHGAEPAFADRRPLPVVRRRRDGVGREAHGLVALAALLRGGTHRLWQLVQRRVRGRRRGRRRHGRRVLRHGRLPRVLGRLPVHEHVAAVVGRLRAVVASVRNAAALRLGPSLLPR
mmetsp:Transcript_53644/g.164972  ORF Transcript_53644/g.164972 Transcript_53644/m.164972 type:complete len:483 (-) Transcript_53644:173-1621(-)